MKNIQDLYDFIDRAAKSYNYPANTAQSLKSAIKRFEPLLSADERGSVQKLKENMDSLALRLFNKDKDVNPSSLTTYKSRAMRVISDFEKYGGDPSKMAGWKVKPVTRVKNKKDERRDANVPIKNIEAPVGAGYNQVNVVLNGRKFICVVPSDMTQEEFKKLSAMLGF